MRRILVDHARKRRAKIRGGGQTKLALDEALAVPGSQGVESIALDEALNALAELDPEQCRIVELRFFGGLANDEVAEVMGISSAKVRREWTTAKTWLYTQIRNR